MKSFRHILLKGLRVEKSTSSKFCGFPNLGRLMSVSEKKLFQNNNKPTKTTYKNSGKKLTDESTSFDKFFIVCQIRISCKTSILQ